MEERARNKDICELPYRHMYRLSAGFTLIELLVVIAIIVILTGIIFPVFTSAKEKGRQTVCTSNMKQLGMAFASYTQEWDDTLPGAGPGSLCLPDGGTGDWVPADWVNDQQPCHVELGAIYPYVNNKQIYTCPSDNHARTKKLSYAMSYVCSWQSLAYAQHPSETIFLVDEGPILNDGFFALNMDEKYTDVPTDRHNGGANYCFLDGHVKLMSIQPLINLELFVL